MKLELKHLSPYLPYGLKLKYDRPDGPIETITSIYDADDYDTIKIKIGYRDAEHIWMFKPILRPLSDLNKMIQHPTDKAKNANLALCYDLEADEEGDYCDRIYADQCESPSALVSITSFNWWLFEWHFDVFGLIDAGLAISTEALNKEAKS